MPKSHLKLPKNFREGWKKVVALPVYTKPKKAGVVATKIVRLVQVAGVVGSKTLRLVQVAGVFGTKTLCFSVGSRCSW
jgi:hypothetical protein